MADDNLIIDYRVSEARVRAHVHQADPEPWVRPLEFDADEIHRERLNKTQISKRALTKFLEDRSRASEDVYLFCDYEVWLRLLKLLDVRPPIPDVVRWPREP